MQSVVAARGDRPFRDLSDFAARIDPTALNRMQIESLARAGAFDSLEKNRARVFASEQQTERLRLAEAAEWEPMEALSYEAEAIGFHLTAHPLDAYSHLFRRLGVVPSNQLFARAAAGPAKVALAGTVIAVKTRNTRTGSRMAWVRLSDLAG